MFVDWNQRELHVKVVYYGPPLSGKTTNLEQIHGRLPKDRRGEIVSVNTREDRTLFFDFMELDLGAVNGLTPKFKLYTVPGQVYYKATRRIVLKGVDGVVFVADSSVKRIDDNRRALHDMRRHLQQLGHERGEVPFILQCNKQDLSDAVKPELLGRALAVPRAVTVPAIAIRGEGTTETLRRIVSQTLDTL